MNELYLFIGMVLVVAIAAWATIRELQKPVMPTLEQQIKASWQEHMVRLHVDEHIGKDAE